MNALTSSLALVLLLTLSMGCVGGDSEDGEFGGADAGFASVPDAEPAPVFPDADVPEPEPEPEPEEDPSDFPIELACSLDDIQPIFECVSENCLDSLADGNLLTCVTLNCGLLFLSTPPECTQCIITGISDTSMALDACVLGLDDLGNGGGFGGGNGGGNGGGGFPPFPQP